MSRKFLCILAALLLIEVVLFLPQTGYAASSFSGGSGTRSDPYLISTADQLDQIRINLNASYKLSNDIDVSTLRGNNWLPIGSETTPFKGTFDGNGFTINGFNMIRNDKYCGLFGYAVGASLKNIKMKSVSMTGGAYSGAIVGWIKDGSITNCSVTGDIICIPSDYDKSMSQPGYAGGIAGEIYTCTSTDCTFSGTINSFLAGGLFGIATQKSTIKNCSSSSDITATYAGGLVANVSSATNVVDSEASGTIRCISNSGGFTQMLYGATISNCISSVDISILVSDSQWISATVGGFAGDVYGGMMTDCLSTGEIVDLSGKNATIGGFLGSIQMETAFNNCFWINNTSATSIGKGGNNTGIKKIGSLYNTFVPVGQRMSLQTSFKQFPLTITPKSCDKTDILQINADGTVTGLSEGTAAITIDILYDGNTYASSINVDVGTIFPSGSGTPVDPYIINNTNALMNTKKYPGAFYKLAYDISLYNISNWTPIGISSDPFTGGLDGDGHTISGLTICSSNLTDIGLFGYTVNATFKNINLSDAFITVGIHSGALAGRMYKGNISDCSATGKVTNSISPNVFAGMLVGYMDQGTLSNCYAIGDVSSYYAGVFAGYMGGTMTNCYWYSSNAERGAAKGSSTNLNRINVAIDNLTIGQQVQGSVTSSYKNGLNSSPGTGAQAQSITLSPTTNFKLYGNPAIQFIASSNSSVATVSGGILTAKSAGSTIITTKFIYANGKTATVDYKINVATPPPSAYLSGVKLSVGTLSKSFSKSSYSYKIALGENQDSVTITPFRENSSAAMTINGKSASSYTVSLKNGKSATVTVKVKFGKTTKTYKFTVTRAKSTNNNLATLTASTGKFNRAFDPTVTGYTLTLDESTKSVKISDTVASSLASASFKSKTVSLSNGQTTKVTITVKAQSGAKKTYTITVKRAPSTNTGLKYLKTNSGSNPLTPAYSAGVTNYTITLPASHSSVTISAKTTGYKATLYFDGAKKTSKKVTLASGQSVTIRVTIVAQAGNKKEYTITIRRQ